MIKYSSTRRIIRKLDSLYNQSAGYADTEIPIIYAKAAHLEFCGWIEESFDEIAHNCVRKRMPLLRQRKLITEKIAATHGFEYNSKARPLLIHSLGAVRFTEIESELAQDGSLDILKGMLGTLNSIRRVAAHSSLSGTTQTFPAPSITLSNFEKCLPLLNKLWNLVS